MAIQLTPEQERKYWAQRIEGWTEAKTHKLNDPGYWPTHELGRTIALRVFRRNFGRDPKIEECGAWFETWNDDPAEQTEQTS